MGSLQKTFAEAKNRKPLGKRQIRMDLPYQVKQNKEDLTSEQNAERLNEKDHAKETMIRFIEYYKAFEYLFQDSPLKKKCLKVSMEEVFPPPQFLIRKDFLNSTDNKTKPPFNEVIDIIVQRYSQTKEVKFLAGNFW